MRRFGNSFISMLRPSEMIRDQYPEGFASDSFMDGLLVTAIIDHTIEVKVNQ